VRSISMRAFLPFLSPAPECLALPTSLFFIPRQPEMYLWATEWWRQHANVGTSYVVHVNTGCEDMDHTRWAVASEGYRWPVVNRSHLYCCHAPPSSGCYCDITQYSFGTYGCLGVVTDTSVRFLGTDAPQNLYHHSQSSLRFDRLCKQGEFVGGASWRETYYQGPHSRSLAEVEWFGLEWQNNYLCLAVADEGSCQVGALLKLFPCSKGGNETRTLLQPDFSACEGDTFCRGVLRLSSCPDMCVGSDANGVPALSNCESESAILTRTRLRG